MPSCAGIAGFVLFLLLLATGGATAGTFELLADPRPVDTLRLVIERDVTASEPLEDVLPDGPAIVHFWATWCAPCREELPALARYRAYLQETGKADRVVIVALERVSLDRIRTFLDEDLGLPDLPVLKHGDGRAGPAFALFGLPATVLLDGERNVVARHAGPVDWDGETTRETLMRFLADKP